MNTTTDVFPPGRDDSRGRPGETVFPWQTSVLTDFVEETGVPLTEKETVVSGIRSRRTVGTADVTGVHLHHFPHVKMGVTWNGLEFIRKTHSRDSKECQETVYTFRPLCQDLGDGDGRLQNRPVRLTTRTVHPRRPSKCPFGPVLGECHWERDTCVNPSTSYTDPDDKW